MSRTHRQKALFSLAPWVFLLVMSGCSDRKDPSGPSISRAPVQPQHQMSCPMCYTWQHATTDGRLQDVIDTWMQSSECSQVAAVLQDYLDTYRLEVWNDANSDRYADWHWGSAIHFNIAFYENLTDYQFGWILAHEAGHEINWSDNQNDADAVANYCMPGGDPRT